MREAHFHIKPRIVFLLIKLHVVLYLNFSKAVTLLKDCG